jgi:hypothetical protein
MERQMAGPPLGSIQKKAQQRTVAPTTFQTDFFRKFADSVKMPQEIL